MSANTYLCPAQGEEKLTARKKLGAPGSKLHEWLAKIDAKLGANPSGFAVGFSLTMADVRAFCEFSSMISGWYDGIPLKLFATHSNIQKHRAKIASMPVRSRSLPPPAAIFVENRLQCVTSLATVSVS